MAKDKYFRIPATVHIKGMAPGEKPGDPPKLGMVPYPYASFIQEFVLSDPQWRKRNPEDFRAVVEALVESGPGQIGRLDAELASIVHDLVMAINFAGRDVTLTVALMPYMHASTMPRDKAPKGYQAATTKPAAAEPDDEEAADEDDDAVAALPS